MQNANTAVSSNNLEKHKELTLFLVRKFNMSMEKAYDYAHKIYKQEEKPLTMSKAMLAQTLASLFQYRYKEEMQMIIIIKDGYDVIDNRPEAEIAQSERDYFEERYNRDLKRKLEANKHPFAKKLLSACGLL